MNELIRASAGSGKTYQLSSHFLRRLFQGQRPDSILATTFTRKAAGEILGRVLLRLAEAALSEEQAAQLQAALNAGTISRAIALKMLADLTRSLHRLRICTLDSFFQQAARGLTLELGLTPGWTIVDPHDDARLREQAIDAVLAQQLPQDAQQLMQMLAKGKHRRSVRLLIDETVQNYHELYQQTSEAAWQQIPRGQRLSDDVKTRTLSALQAVELPADKRIIKARDEDVQRFKDELWDDFISTGIAAKVLAGEQAYYKKELSDEVLQIYGRLLQHARAELLERIALQMQAVRSLISRFDVEFSRLRAEHGWLGFSDVTRTLARSVDAASGKRLNFRMDSSLRNLLLDEFQDTSSDQWKVLRRLVDSLRQHADSSVFCVGDGKQAIYGWRGGMAEILDAVPVAVPGIRETGLNDSRRSAPAVMQAVNQVFQHIASHPELAEYHDAVARWQARFPEHSTVRSGESGYAVFRTEPEFEGETAAERRGPRFAWLAQQVAELYQQLPGREIGVLTRGNAAVARLVHELTALGVPASEEGGTAPTDSPAVLAVLALLQFASHPACTVSRWHVSQSPLGAVVGLTDWQDDRLAGDVAAGLRAQLVDQGYGPFLQSISESIRSHCSARDRLRMSQLVSAGWQFDQSGSLNPCDFIRLLENSRFQKKRKAPVRVMTIHQSKGLEFDCVVLPELDTSLFKPPEAAAGSPATGEPADRVCVWVSKQQRMLLPDSLQEAFSETIGQKVAESLCLFYVAMTRARRCLVMLSPPLQSGKPPKTFAGLLLAALSDNSQAGPAETVWETGDPAWHVEPAAVPAKTRGRRAVSAEPAAAAATAPGPGGAVPAVRPVSGAAARILLSPMPDGRRRGLARSAPSRHDQTTLSLPVLAPAVPAAGRGRGAGTAARGRRDAVAGAAVAAAVEPRVRGILLHGWFELLQWLDQQPADQQLLEAAVRLQIPDETARLLLPEFRRLLQTESVRRTFDRETGGAASVFQPWRKQLASGAAQLVVDRERPFVLLERSQLVRGTIDRLVQLKVDGRIVAADIVDFKTDRVSGEVAEWIDGRVAYYGSQLQEYRRAAARICRLDPAHVQARLLLLQADAVVQVE
jgi:ATP-dependent exoDNAse (exonuclease V) beta subunit